MAKYKEALPLNCPFAEAKESERVLYRIFSDKSATQNNFRSYISIYHERKDLKDNCKAYGLSFFDSKGVAIEYIKRNPSLGSFVAEVEVKPEHGKLMLTNKKNGHYTLWLYESFDPANLICKIEPIRQDVATN